VEEKLQLVTFARDALILMSKKLRKKGAKTNDLQSNTLGENVGVVV